MTPLGSEGGLSLPRGYGAVRSTIMQIFSTGAMPAKRGAAHWASIYGRFAPLSVKAAREDRFSAELRLGRMGALDIACVCSDGARVERTRSHTARAADRQFGVVIILQGRGAWSHCGREGPIGAGDILVSDNTRPIVCQFDDPVSGVTIRAGEAMLRAHLPFIDDVCGVRLPAESGLTRAASAIATCLAEQADLDAPTEYGATMAGHFLDVLATSYAMACERPVSGASVVNMRKALARQFIETHLPSPDLTPASVAEALRISPRYLRLLMSEDGESASGLILRRRLEECARRLASPLWRDSTITQIAFAWGFNSTAHFARVFRSRFGLSPRDYRQAAAREPSA